MNRNRKTLLLSRNVKTKQQVHREVKQRGVAFQMLAKWQADYWLLKGKQNESALERMAENARELGLDYCKHGSDSACKECYMEKTK